MRSAGSIGSKTQGASTLELIIAFAIVMLSLTAVVLVVYSNQAMTIDAELGQQAIAQANKLLEETRAESAENFNSVNSIEKSLDVSDLSECLKLVTSNITYGAESRAQKVSLTTNLGSPRTWRKLGSDCDLTPPSDWSASQAYGPSNQIHPGSQGTDIDIVTRADGRFALLTSTKAGSSDSSLPPATLWMINVDNPQTPVSTGSYSNDEENMNAIDATDNFAFVASASTTVPFQVVDISDPAALKLVAARALPEVNAGRGQSIYFYDNKIYLGTQYLLCPPSCPSSQNNELHIFDVSNPATPVWEASINVDRKVNDLVVRDGLAYLATGAGAPGVNNPFKIYDVDPASATYLEEIGSFTTSGNEQGTALYLAGNNVYLGTERAVAPQPDFYVLDVSDPTNIISIDSLNLNLNSNKQVAGVVVRSLLAFVVTTDTTPANGGGPFLVYDVSRPGHQPGDLPLISTCPLTYSAKAAGLDVVDDLVFIANESSNALGIIRPTLTCS